MEVSRQEVFEQLLKYDEQLAGLYTVDVLESPEDDPCARRLHRVYVMLVNQLHAQAIKEAGVFHMRMLLIMTLAATGFNAALLWLHLAI